MLGQAPGAGIASSPSRPPRRAEPCARLHAGAGVTHPQEQGCFTHLHAQTCPLKRDFGDQGDTRVSPTPCRIASAAARLAGRESPLVIPPFRWAPARLLPGSGFALRKPPVGFEARAPAPLAAAASFRCRVTTAASDAVAQQDLGGGGGVFGYQPFPGRGIPSPWEGVGACGSRGVGAKVLPERGCAAGGLPGPCRWRGGVRGGACCRPEPFGTPRGLGGRC